MRRPYLSAMTGNASTTQFIEYYCDPNRVPTQEELDFMKAHEERMRPYLPALKYIEAALTQGPMHKAVMVHIRVTESKPLISQELESLIERMARHATLKRIYGLR